MPKTSGFNLEKYLGGDDSVYPRGPWTDFPRDATGPPVFTGAETPATTSAPPVPPYTRENPDLYYGPGTVPRTTPYAPAATYAPSATATGTAAPFDMNTFRSAYEQLIRGRSGTTEDWLSYVWPALQKQFPGLELFGSNQDKIRFPGGLGIFDAVLSAGAGGRGYNPFSLEQEGGAGAGLPGGGEFTDPWGAQYEQMIWDRIRSLGMDMGFPSLQAFSEALQSSAANKQQYTQGLVEALRGRVEELNAPPYTSQQEAAIKAGYMDPLERRRQETLKNAREEQYAKGFEPTSGTVRERDVGVNTQFEQARTGIESDLLRSSIGEQQRRRDQAVGLEGLIEQALSGADIASTGYLGQVADTERYRYQTGEQRQQDAINAAMSVLALMDTRQGRAAQAAGLGGDSGTAWQAIMQLLGLGQSQQGLNLQSSANNMTGLGQLLALLMGSGGR